MNNEYIISLVAVGDFYTEEIMPHYEKFKVKGLDVNVLTDKPELFNNGDTTQYTKSVFNYFDKIFHSLYLIEKYNKSVIYLDGSSNIDMNNLTTHQISSYGDFTYFENWPAGNFFNYKDEKCFRFLLEYFEYRNIKLKDYPTISEKIMIFNKSLNHKLVKHELEKIQPVFDYISLMNDMTYIKPFVLGGAEGLALSIILTNNNIPFSKVKLDENNKMSLG